MVRKPWYPLAVVARRCLLGALLSVILAIFQPSKASAQANVQGQWQVLPYQMPVNPIHIALLPSGNVLVVQGSGNDAQDWDKDNFEAAVWNPVAGTVTTEPVTWDMFCNGMALTPNGQVLIAGGTQQYGPFLGLPNASLYDPIANVFTNLPNMADGRWYPTVTKLPDGTLMVSSGVAENGQTNNTVEIYNPVLGTWSTPYADGWVPPLYPRLHVLPNGNVFYSGSTPQSRYFYPATDTWSGIVATTNSNTIRTYGSSVLLPLTPANNYDPKIMILGGGTSGATNTTELIDLGAANPAWTWGPPMSQARVDMDAVLLPNGLILALNGSVNSEDATTASLNADLIDPNALTVTSAGQESYARLYHSGALLLPNGTVAVFGGNPSQGNYQPAIELY